jgi:hypothetical protein
VIDHDADIQRLEQALAEQAREVAALIVRCDALEASLLEARAYILAINTQKPRVARE